MKVAVIGSGVSGLGATWLLNEYSAHEVHLYEADSRAGGHANTVPFSVPGKDSVDETPVDTGFIVLNPATYPNFLRFLKLEGIEVLPTEMTFSLSRDNGQFEWAGKNIFTFFCQPRRVFTTRSWRLVYDILRFNATSRRILVSGEDDATISIGRYLQKHRYSDTFRDDYLIPMTAAVWSTPPDKCSLDFPVFTLIRFMHNHHLLQLTGKPSWLTIRGGSHEYVKRVLSRLPLEQLHLASPVHSVKVKIDDSSPVLLETTAGHRVEYDHVVFACHSDEVVRILRNGTSLGPEQERILSKFKWNKNEAFLHADTNLMPRRRQAWSCWNYLTTSVRDKSGATKANVDQISLTYWMNDLQHISEKRYGNVLVTLNPPFEPREDSIVGRWKYDHPLLNSDAVSGQSEMHMIQNTRGVSYAGAYLRYGFHEDGFTSGLRVAVNHLGAASPFSIISAESEARLVCTAHIFDFIESIGGPVPMLLTMVSLGTAMIWLLDLP